MDGQSWKERGLPQPNRFIITHDEHGKAVFSTQHGELVPWREHNESVFFGYPYLISKLPASFGPDLATYQSFLENPPAIHLKDGVVVRICDFAPRLLVPMHRTVSLDFGVVLAGEVILTLDSGEKRTMKAGDISVQRATMHQWENPSPDKWARVLYVLLPAEAPQVNGRVLPEDTTALS